MVHLWSHCNLCHCECIIELIGELVRLGSLPLPAKARSRQIRGLVINCARGYSPTLQFARQSKCLGGVVCHLPKSIQLCHPPLHGFSLKDISFIHNVCWSYSLATILHKEAQCAIYTRERRNVCTETGLLLHQSWASLQVISGNVE